MVFQVRSYINNKPLKGKFTKIGDLPREEMIAFDAVRKFNRLSGFKRAESLRDIVVMKTQKR